MSRSLDNTIHCWLLTNTCSGVFYSALAVALVEAIHARLVSLLVAAKLCLGLKKEIVTILQY